MRFLSPAKPSEVISQIKRAVMVLAIASLCACRVETPGNDPDPDPTPDPTPTPTVSPTPTPTPTVSPTPTPTPTPSAAALSQQVVATNAGIMQAATADSQTQAAVLRSALVADTSNDATLNSAETALVTSQTAYLHAETSLYYDEDSSKIAKDAPHAAAFDEVATKLDKTARHSPTKRASSAQSTASETEDLQEELTQLAKAWDSSDATNFRNQVFLPSPDDSVARIFQGVIALTESVLPDEIAQSSEPLSLERINGRLFVVKNLFDGKYIGLNGEFYDGPGLKHLIERKDVGTAAEISATIDKAISLAPTAENGGSFNSEELQSTLEILTKQLAGAAKDLGYKVKRGMR